MLVEVPKPIQGFGVQFLAAALGQEAAQDQLAETLFRHLHHQVAIQVHDQGLGSLAQVALTDLVLDQCTQQSGFSHVAQAHQGAALTSGNAAGNVVQVIVSRQECIREIAGIHGVSP